MNRSGSIPRRPRIFGVSSGVCPLFLDGIARPAIDRLHVIAEIERNRPGRAPSGVERHQRGRGQLADSAWFVSTLDFLYLSRVFLYRNPVNSLPNRGVIQSFRSYGASRPDQARIQVGQRRQRPWFDQRGIGLEPPFSDSRLDVVLAIRSASDVFAPCAHEPREIVQPLSIDFGNLHDGTDLRLRLGGVAAILKPKMAGSGSDDPTIWGGYRAVALGPGE